MAIKISGNTVIDDSRNIFANTVAATSYVGDGSALVDLPELFQPFNVFPRNNSTDIGLNVNISSSPFISTVGASHCNTCIQVSECSDFSTCIVVSCNLGGCDTFPIANTVLSSSTQYFYRVRYEDSRGCCTSFSNTTCFTTSANNSGAIGDPAGGGYYIGDVGGNQIIVSPVTYGSNCCAWKADNTTTSGTTSTTDGLDNTCPEMEGILHPAGNWTATQNIDGFTDWYLPSICELKLLSDNKNCLPFSERPEANSSIYYWSSTERDSTTACVMELVSGTTREGLPCCSKTTELPIRAFRRLNG